MDSLEEKVFMFIDEEYYSNESELDEDLWWQDNTHSHGSPDNTLYWESQVSLLQETLERYHVGGSKLRVEVGRIIEEVKGSDFCSCLKRNPWDCSSCLRREVVTELRDRGFSTKLCISKWGTTKKFPGGCHEYIEVIAKTSTRKKQIHILIELELREQFQIAKAGENYQHLVSCLPQFYIGKAENLSAIVRVMCNAAKKSMKEKKMHVGPWRKSSFMQMKWSGFNQTYHNNNNNNKSFETHTTYPTQHSTRSYLTIAGAPTPVVVT
ncbi:hypothetical protein LR48_Vigan442s010700 [Vigna angularis]|uniref:Uncharacterized protein n=2 Tax=Phaseolus angularis TaxID=3914 RepID=A0A0L9TBB6_PHAAN|nr:uncharacterized protein LOC108320848 [Vigna angularis]KAG2375571.1 uncharacterized protein HKW66_Vig0162750 [Vigna angularis]KOM27671.1 hypothetical protein LR48_Vigan442s010700 [Vigna angularis]BAU00679.1 hypothetical protein VIGAN_10229300 [Vigna angularis var. angularis]